MKPVQHYLRHADRKRLLRELSYDLICDPLTLLDLTDKTVREIQDNYEAQMGELIDTLLKMTACPHENHVLLLYDTLGENGRELKMDLCNIQELREDIHASGYAFELEERANTLGYLVADNKLTQDNMYTLLVEYLKEITFFGISEERHHKEVQEVERKLDDAIRDVEEGKVTSAKDVLERIRKEHDWPEPERDDEQDRLEGKALEAMRNFEAYSLARERRRVLAEGTR